MVSTQYSLIAIKQMASLKTKTMSTFEMYFGTLKKSVVWREDCVCACVCVHICICIYLDHSNYEDPVSVWRYEMRALG